MDQAKQIKKPLSLFHYIVPPFLLAFITAVVYSPSLNYEFQFDDLANITKHFSIRHNTFEQLFFNGTRWISYWLNSLHFKIGRFDPFSYRAFNIGLHTVNGLLVFFILLYGLSLLKKQNSFYKKNAFPLAFTTSLLFLLHPVQTQTVSYIIQGQLEGLACFFILSMILCFQRMTQSTNTFVRYFFGLLLFVLAPLSTGSKEIAIMSPVFLLLFDWFFIAQGNWQSLKKRFIVHGLFAGIIIGLYLWLLKPKFFTDIIGLQRVAKNNIGNIITHNPRSKITIWMYFTSQFKVILHYIWMFIWPFNISVEYDWLLCRSFFSPDCLAPLSALVAIFYSIYRLLQKNYASLTAFGLVWFFVAIAPRSSIIPSPELLVDYKTYSASFGLLFLLASGLIICLNYLLSCAKTKILFKNKQTAQIATSIIFVSLLGLVTVQRNTVWRSGVEFWDNIIKNAPGKARAYNNYGVELSQKQHKYRESIPYFQQAIAMDNNYPDPHNNLAVAYAVTKQLDKAIKALSHGLKINPYYPEGYNNLAAFYLRKKNYIQAEKILHTALKIRPYYGKAFYNLGRVYTERSKNEKDPKKVAAFKETAWKYFKCACTKGDLDNKFGFSIYARSSLGLKKFDDALFAYKKILDLEPGNRDALFDSANAHYFKKDFSQAKKIFKQLVDSNPNDKRSLYNLGETFFSLKEPKSALKCFKLLLDDTKTFPQARVRMAACWEKMGDPKKSQLLLRELLTIKGVPTDMKLAAHNVLQNLQKKYNLPSEPVTLHL